MTITVDYGVDVSIFGEQTNGTRENSHVISFPLTQMILINAISHSYTTSVYLPDLE